MKRAFAVVSCLVFGLASVTAQFRPVAPGQTGERLVAIVPMVNDPVKKITRPMFVDLAGVTAFKAILSDDGRWALVEIVAKTRSALTPAFNSAAFSMAATGRLGLPPDVNPRITYKDSGQVDSILADFAKLKRGFRVEHFGLGGR